MKILLCEDDPSNRRGLQELLSLMGYNVIAAQTGREAIAMSKKRNRPIDLLISDAELSDMRGAEVARKISKAIPNLPVLFVSTAPFDMLNRRDVRNLRRLCCAAFDWLEKPFPVVALREKVGRLLRRFSRKRHSRREFQRLELAPA
jgi:DNA-binding response OmpR family regulator